MKNIWWIRRDIRLHDNYALQAALRNNAAVIPVFILDLNLVKEEHSRRLAFLLQALTSLEEDLKKLGSGLVIRDGKPDQELAKLLRETGADTIFAEEDHTPYAIKRDAKIAEDLPLVLLPGQLVIQPSDLLKQDGTPYTVFTPFSKKWRSQLPASIKLLPAPSSLPKTDLPISARFPELKNETDFFASETEARQRLARFTSEEIYRYHDKRNDMAADSTSKLSPYLRFGLISHRQAAKEASSALANIWLQANNMPEGVLDQGPNTWLNELIWREFYINILKNFPYIQKTSFDKRFDRMIWQNDPDDLIAWKNGRTGVPIVDAGMRQLKQTGWMHNRARMITASYLVKHLLIDWREGERWFARQLVDADVAANNGGWQWVAGTGTDAAPYFRIFNPVLQSKKFDPDGKYIRKWVKELENVPDKFIHEPWLLNDKDQRSVSLALGMDYPYPLVDHNFARQRALSVYKVARNTD